MMGEHYDYWVRTPETRWGAIDIRAVTVLVNHQRRDSGSCICGWGAPGALGQSHAVHVWRQLQAAGVDRRMVPDTGDDTLRLELARGITAHVLWRGHLCMCEEPWSPLHVADALLPLIREHTAEAWDEGYEVGCADTPWEDGERAEAAEALLSDLADPSDCVHDHHGHCQTHGWMETDPPCPHARAKLLLHQVEQADETEGTDGR